MEALIQSILTFVLVYKYAAIFLITFLGAIALPLPVTTMLVASGYFATEEYFSFWYVFLAGFLGNVVGDSLGYWLARRYGEPVLNKIGFRTFLRSDGFLAIEQRLRDHPFVTIFVSRFTSALTPFVNILAGMARIPYKSFLLIDLLGEAAYTLLMCSLGYLFGSQWMEIESVFGNISTLLAVLIILSIVFIWRNRRKRTKYANNL